MMNSGLDELESLVDRYNDENDTKYRLTWSQDLPATAASTPEPPPVTKFPGMAPVHDVLVDHIRLNSKVIVEVSSRGVEDLTLILGQALTVRRELDRAQGTTFRAERGVEELIADVLERKAFGLKKYNSTLQAFNGRDALVDAYQELLDGACYLMQHKIEQTVSPFLSKDEDGGER